MTAGKTCTRCEVEKSLDAFSRHRAQCRQCRVDIEGTREREHRASNSGLGLDLRRYNLTPDEYLALLAAQGGGCAVCAEAPTASRRLVIDHDHSCCADRARSCGKCVRGLLCAACNSMLGMAKDNTSTLLSGISYLTKDRP